MPSSARPPPSLLPLPCRQVVTIVTEGGRLELPPRERLPGPDSQTWGELDAYKALLTRCWAQAPDDRPRFKEIITDLR